VREKQAAECWTYDDPNAGDCRPRRYRLWPFARRGDGVQNRERGGHDESSAEAHDHPVDYQHARVRCERRRQAAQSEDDKSPDEREAAAVAVAKGSGRDQKGGEAQRVGIHDPLQ
jgi:hypothetical protein